MKIQVNAGRRVEGHLALAAEVEPVVAMSLQCFADHVTPVEAHLSDENRAKGGGDDSTG